MLSWRYHPASKNKLKAAFVTAIIFLFGFFVWWYTQLAIFALLAAVILTASLGVFFFPTKYTLTEGDLTVEFLGTKVGRFCPRGTGEKRHFSFPLCAQGFFGELPGNFCAL
jgi:hypothetical protein